MTLQCQPLSSRNTHWYFGVGVTTGIPFKQSTSGIILWSHTHSCWSSFFSDQAQSGKRSEQNSYREAVWPSTPLLLWPQFKDRNEIQAGCGYAVGCEFGQSSSIVISSVLPNPWVLKVLSLIHYFSTLWTLSRKSWCFRSESQWQVSSKSRVHKMLHQEASVCLWPPFLQSCSSLHCPTFQSQTHTACSCCTCSCFCLQSLCFCMA